MLAFPTETFYGLGCCADQAVAVARVYQAKRRPVHMPLPLLAGSLDLLRPYVTLEQAPEALLTAFWPGPLTVVLTARLTPLEGRRPLAPQLVNPKGKAAVRLTPHPLAAQLSRLAGAPLTASSANISGQAAARVPDELDERLLAALTGPGRRRAVHHRGAAGRYGPARAASGGRQPGGFEGRGLHAAPGLSPLRRQRRKAHPGASESLSNMELAANMLLAYHAPLEAPMQKELTCPACGHSVIRYLNPAPTTDVVIYDPERGVVVIERVNEPHGFALPGGFVDDGEQVEHAAVREMREETGLDVELLGVLGVYSRPDRDPRRHTMSVVFVGRPRDAAALKAGDDAARAAFYPLDRLPQPICFDHARILADFGRWLAGERTLAPVEPAGEDD